MILTLDDDDFVIKSRFINNLQMIGNSLNKTIEYGILEIDADEQNNTNLREFIKFDFELTNDNIKRLKKLFYLDTGRIEKIIASQYFKLEIFGNNCIFVEEDIEKYQLYLMRSKFFKGINYVVIDELNYKKLYHRWEKKINFINYETDYICWIDSNNYLILENLDVRVQLITEKSIMLIETLNEVFLDRWSYNDSNEILTLEVNNYNQLLRFFILFYLKM
jgi:hypothetical protein